MTKLTIDELLAKAEDKSKQRRRIENNVNTIRYIEHYKWEAGTLAIPTCVIFWHYRTQFTETRIETKVNKTTFFRTFSKRFPSCRKNHQRYYLLKEGIIDLTPELLEKCKSYDKQHWQKKKRQKKTVQLLGQEGNNAN
jgi:hypothetical protein